MVRGLAALIVLLGLLVGIPAGLITFGGNPMPSSLSWDAVGQALLRPASDRALIGIVTIVGWLAWAAFAASVAAELVNTASGRRIQLQLPGLGVGQKLAATLIVAVVIMLAVPTPMQTAAARPTPPAPTPTAATSAPATAPSTAPSTASAADPTTSVPTERHSRPDTVDRLQQRSAERASGEGADDPGPKAEHGGRARTDVHVVQRGEWLWSIAERYLGDGSRWKEIVDANPGIDRDHLVGQKLLIPIDAGNNVGFDQRRNTDDRDDAQRGDSNDAPEKAKEQEEAEERRADRPRRVETHEGDTVTVKRGDSLWEISDDLYGDPHHWPELYRENREQIDDPDLIDIGWRLDLPEDRKRLADSDHKVSHRHPDLDDSAVEKRQQAGERDEKRADRRSAARPQATPGDGGSPGSVQERTGSRRSSSETAERDRESRTDQNRDVCAPADGPGASAEPTAPPTTQPSPGLPGAAPNGDAGGGGTAPAPAGSTPETASPDSGLDSRATAAVSVGLLLAAGLITTINLRRRRQLRARRPGRRILSPTAEAGQLEQSVKAMHQPLRVEQLDQVTRAIAAHSHNTGTDLPALSAVRVADHRIDLLFSRPADHPPDGVTTAADGSVWTLHAADLATVLAVDGLDDATPPYPALVTLGRDADDAHILIDLEAAGALTVAADTEETAAAMMATIALELSMSPWAGDLSLTFVGQLLPGFADALDHPAVTHVDDVDQVLTGLEDRARTQRPYLTDTTVGQKRADPELADAWCPQVVLFGQELDPEQADRLAQVVADLPRVAIAAVTTDPAITAWRFDVDTSGAGHLSPHDWQLTPPLVSADQYRDILDLVASSGSDDTTPAPWWDHDAEDHQLEPDQPPAEEQPAATLTVLHTQTPGSTATPASPIGTDTPDEHRQQPTVAGHDSAEDDDPTEYRDTAEGTSVAGPGTATASRAPLNLHALIGSEQRPSASAARSTDGADRLDPAMLGRADTPEHPMLRILGQPDLVGARGTSRSRYQQRSLEFLLFLLEHPGATSARLRSHFNISRDYTKAVISNLRKLLGSGPDGNPYLPEITPRSGYRVRDEVTSDWHYASLLLGRGVNTAASEVLVKVLSMLRSRPLAGAEDWIDVGTLRTDIESQMTDAAHVLAIRALKDNDLRLARWAVGRGLVADPESEMLLTDQLRTEQQAGDRAAVHRLAGRISANARAIGADVCDETLEVLRAVATR